MKDLSEVMKKVKEAHKALYKFEPDLTISIGTDCTRKGGTNEVVIKYRVTISESCAILAECVDESLKVAIIKAFIALNFKRLG